MVLTVGLADLADSLQLPVEVLSGGGDSDVGDALRGGYDAIVSH
jgi:hypothetical protein